MCFDPKWKRLHDLKRVLTEEWQAVGDRDKGLYEVVVYFSIVVQQTLGISEVDGLRAKALVLDCEQIAFMGLANAWDSVMGDADAVRGRDCERNEDVLVRAHKIVLNRILAAEIEAIEEVVYRKMGETVAEARDKNIKLQALLKEHGDLYELPVGQPLAQKMFPCILDAMVQHKKCRKELIERRALRQMKLEVRYFLAKKAKPELMEEPPAASRHP